MYIKHRPTLKADE